MSQHTVVLGYLDQKLMSGSFMELPADERAAFGESLARDARDISDDQLSELFAGDWRERITAGWLVAAPPPTSDLDFIAKR